MIEQFNYAIEYLNEKKGQPTDAETKISESNHFVKLLVRVNLEIDRIKKNPEYITSHNDFGVFIELMLDIKSQKDRNLILRALFTINDLLYKKDVDGDSIRLSYIETVTKKINIHSISLKENSHTTASIIEKFGDGEDRDSYLRDIEENKYYINFNKDNNMEYLISSYDYRSYTYDFILAIEYIYKNTQDKEKFASDFFACYIKLFPTFRYPYKFYFLQEIVELIVIFSEELTLEQLQRVLSVFKLSEQEKETSLEEVSSESKKYCGELLIIAEFFTNFFSNNFKNISSSIDICNDLIKMLPALIKYAPIKIEEYDFQEIKKFDADICLSKLPLVMQTFIADKQKNIQKEFKEFVLLFIKVNDKADRNHQKDIKSFFFKHHDVICQLMKIIGETETISFLRQQLAYTVLTLDQTLEGIPILSKTMCDTLTSYFDHIEENIKSPSELEIFVNIIFALCILTQIKSHDTKDKFLIEIIQAGQKNNTNPKEMLTLLAKKLFSKIFEETIESFTEDQINNIFISTSPLKFFQLISASQRMTNDEYRYIYLKMLKCDLIDKSGESVDNFLHNTHQDDKLGKNLAHHNKRIQEELLKHNIDPSTALQYTKKYDFVVMPGENEDTREANALITLWSYLVKLQKTLDECKQNFPESEIKFKNKRNTLEKINNYINKLDRKIKKSGETNEAIIQELTKEYKNKSISNIINKLKALENKNTTEEFKEFAGHVKEQFKFLSEKKIQSKKIAIHSFRVIQWAKGKPKNRQELENEPDMTFFLGNEVGCCLATDGTRFPAMVQRRMDDAMLFHVVIDLKTKRPAGLIWLYLLQTRNQGIVLMANFFEVHTKYAIDQHVRKALLNGLLAFTNEYLKDNPHIKGFYMNKLTYGWNINDLTNYPICDLYIRDKVGGPFIPNRYFFEEDESYSNIESEPNDVTQNKSTFTREKYYLVSLAQNQFHKFDNEILKQESKNISSKTKDQIIQEGIYIIAIEAFKASGKKINIQNIKNLSDIIAMKYRLELSNFYKTKIENDPDFIADVKRIYNAKMSEKALYFAIRTGNINKAKRLINEFGYDINKALYYAVENWDSHAAELLVKQWEANINQAFYYAIRIKDNDTAELLIKNFEVDINKALYYAVENSDINAVELLIKKWGANVNAVDEYNNHILICAIHTKNQSIIELLIENGANIDRAIASTQKNNLKITDEEILYCKNYANQISKKNFAHQLVGKLEALTLIIVMNMDKIHPFILDIIKICKEFLCNDNLNLADMIKNVIERYDSTPKFFSYSDCMDMWIRKFYSLFKPIVAGKEDNSVSQDKILKFLDEIMVDASYRTSIEENRNRKYGAVAH